MESTVQCPYDASRSRVLALADTEIACPRCAGFGKIKNDEFFAPNEAGCGDCAGSGKIKRTLEATND